MRDLQAFLDKQRGQSLYRTRRLAQSAQGPHMRIDNTSLLTFCSNDYLGLASHPDVVSAFRQGADDYGVGSGAAHLVNGHSLAHHALEEELADFVGRDRALLFSTGYMANLAVVSALADRHTTVFADRLNHASLIDAAQLSEAKHVRYAHADVATLSARLEDSDAEDKLVISDGVFSMDGDLTPLDNMIPRCKQHKAWIMIDDAHGLGVLGAQGRGTLEHFNCNDQVDILVGTLGKAFGTFGAFVAGSHELIETLIQRARSYIYTTALPSAVAEATRASLHIIREDSARREQCHARVRQFRAGAAELGLALMDSFTPIQPLLVGDVARAIAMSEALLAEGILVTAIRPPTVPEGTSRLRFTFSASHSEQDVIQLLEALAKIQ
jgi:8-amino-7-oxononanoate synthase